MAKQWLFILTALVCLTTASYANPHQDAARELMQVSGTEQIMSQMQLQIENMFLNISSDDTYNDKQKQIVKKYRDEVAKLLGNEMQWDQIEKQVVDLYVKSFTEQELKELITFYKTSLGQKMIEKMPWVMLRSAEVAREQMRFVIPRVKDLGKSMNEELRAAQ